MANFAKLDENNIVTEVIFVNNDVVLDQNGVEQEQLGIEFLKKHCKDPNSKWVQTSYNNNFRTRFAGVGYKYDEQKNMFIPQKPYSNFVFSDVTLDWEAPIPEPITVSFTEADNSQTGVVHIWNESLARWEGQSVEDSSRKFLWLPDTLSWEEII